MATQKEFEARVRVAILEAVREILVEGDIPESLEGDCLFTSIENLALSVGDAVALEVFEQKLAGQDLGALVCPKCGHRGLRKKEVDRTIQTRRGLSVPLTEQECYCPACRRAFFPSVESVGLGRKL